MQIPLDPRIKELADIPYTISFIIRKRQQIDNLSEMPSDKKPPESLIWDAPTEELEEWISRAFSPKERGENMIELKIKPSDIEG